MGITHLGAAQAGRRWPVIAELVAAGRHGGDYRGSTEELTPVRRDPRAAIPVAVAVAATVIRPASWRWFTSGSVASYSLSPAGWRGLREYTTEHHNAGGWPARAARPELRHP